MKHVWKITQQSKNMIFDTKKKMKTHNCFFCPFVYYIFMFKCVWWPVCNYVCPGMWCPKVDVKLYSSLRFLHLIVWDSVSRNLVLWIPSTINPRDHLVIVCPQLRLELGATESGLRTWVLNFKLGYLRLYGKQIHKRSRLPYHNRWSFKPADGWIFLNWAKAQTTCNKTFRNKKGLKETNKSHLCTE